MWLFKGKNFTTWVKGGGLVIWRLQRSQRKILDRHPQPKARPQKKITLPPINIEVKDGNLENEWSLQMADQPLSTSMIVWVGILRQTPCVFDLQTLMARVYRTRWTLGQSSFDASVISTCVVNRIAWIARDDVKEERCKWKRPNEQRRDAPPLWSICQFLWKWWPASIQWWYHVCCCLNFDLLYPFMVYLDVWWLTFFVSVGEHI